MRDKRFFSFDEIVRDALTNFGPVVISTKRISERRLKLITQYHYPDGDAVEIFAVDHGPGLVKFTEEGNLIALINNDDTYPYSGRGTGNLNGILDKTDDIRRHFYIDDTIPECYTIANCIGDDVNAMELGQDEIKDATRAFFNLMAVCLILGHIRYEEPNSRDDYDDDESDT